MGGILTGESSAQRSARKKAEEAASQAAAQTEGSEYNAELDAKKAENLADATAEREETLATMQGNKLNKKLRSSGKNFGKIVYDEDGGFIK